MGKSIVGKRAKSERSGKRAAAVLFGIFAIAGSAMFYFMTIRPVSKIFDARSWQEVSCRIISAEVGVHDGDDSDTYSIDIEYEYQFAGRTYKGDRYDFMFGSSSGYDGKAKVVDHYKKAADPHCFVDPDEPSSSVLNRNYHTGYLWGLFPLPFLFIGFGGFIWFIKSRKSTGAADAKWQSNLTNATFDDVMPDAGAAADAVTLKSKSPWAKLAGILFFAAFWNGIVSIFVVQCINGWRSGNGEIVLTIFMIPFVLVGLGCIAFVFYSLLAAFNPRPDVTISSQNIPLGSVAELSWNFTGRVHVISDLKITLKGIESARYRRGTNTHTDKSTFFQMEIFSTDDRFEIESGRAGLVIPADSMHSFEAENNKIIWQLELHGSIDSWPDVKEEYKLNVTPMVAG